ncbi:DUF6624 domain-containing protein [Spirosoma pollinicola]|uniref:Uncharacterized protein n=1 Tax=Spirosoma pollinicola TaxID=2057025 RepID=A0A2K8Z2Q5_9BACT|nr:DUF6624 domain-containing protein [Spirosoma pollinicola]AUD04109.1 hypothetical protein CWM47_21110 [Spirosoma pollinicola]
MMNLSRFFTVLVLSLVTSISYSQTSAKLKLELDSIYRIDQLYREIMMSQPKKDSLAKAENLSAQGVQQLIFDKMNEIDSSNSKRVRQIIHQVGYPGKSLVGEPTNEAAWYVIQHSKNINQFFPLIEEAGQKKELPFKLVAMMQDRLFVNQGKEQLYGTQARCDNPPAGSVGNQQPDCYIWPIRDAAGVNERRKQAGFGDTVEENAKRLGITYTRRSLSNK